MGTCIHCTKFFHGEGLCDDCAIVFGALSHGPTLEEIAEEEKKHPFIEDPGL